MKRNHYRLLNTVLDSVVVGTFLLMLTMAVSYKPFSTNHTHTTEMPLPDPHSPNCPL